ncbi:adenine phosphoribosyltransferase [Robiginitalea sp. M366]|uniref:adenine phosphoribosyltransferase n=1 Tax=Robiginitalea aestuariiviva TaxID=3036903 RepID=UPI00240E562F|nr:adenine phosphoribosyltransferase [Robiginitalea aestuariiviva]MDG1572275.1 adenine phosphoribosyltransferase [Robiginitalea aestuariiviva]
MNFKAHIRDVPDFPAPGIVFKDITTLLEHPEAFRAAADALLAFADGLEVDKVVGIESRGFFFAPLLARELGAGFIPARKPGKLPRRTQRQDYELEYGTDALELHAESISPGDKVLVHDDVLATGGTARALCDLVTALGGQVVQCNFLIELTFLGGRQKLEGLPLKALVRY